MRCTSLIFVALLAASVSAADNPPGGDDWKYDIVYRKKGDSYQGLVTNHADGRLSMWCILRRPGRPTIYYRVCLPESEIERVDLLPDEPRQALRKRLESLQEERKRLMQQQKSLDPDAKEPPTGADALDLRRVPWPGDPAKKALAYQSSYFRLISNAPRRVVVVTAIRLEQVYAAYGHSLPPRAKGEATLILLPQSLADYRRLVRGEGRTLLNPAFFDAGKNQIVCAFDWQYLVQERERLRDYHAKLLTELSRREAELRQAYKGEPPAELKEILAEKRKQIAAAEARNRDICHLAQQRLFQRLFHEAFHAYLVNFVYTPEAGELPRWLNEGLAQIFETAIFELGELRVGHADKERLDAVRGALRKNTLLPLIDLLRAGAKQFQVAHDGDKQVADRYYLESWALAHYLTFDRKVLRTPALDEYVRELKRGGDPLAAFTTLVGQPLSRFERDFHEYLSRLHPDGSVGKGG